DLVDAGVAWPEFNHLGTKWRDETAIRGTAAGACRWRDGADRLDRRGNGIAQWSFPGEEGFAGKIPVDVEIQRMAGEAGFEALPQASGRARRAEAEVEGHIEAARDDVAGAGAGMDVGNLQTRRREIGVAFIPARRRQFGQGGGRG